MRGNIPDRPAAALRPIVLDEPSLRALASAGYRWKEGQAELVRYRWLLPPDWVLAAELPDPTPAGIEPLCGAGDRSGRLTAVLGVLRGPSREPSELAATGAAPGARLGAFVSRAGPVGERVELRDGKKVVLTVHGFQAGGESYRFFVTSMGAADDPAAEEVLRTIGAALSLEDLAPFVRGRLHG